MSVVLFDLDDTITTRDTFVAYLLYVLQRRCWRFSRCIWLIPAIVRYKLGVLSNEELKRRFLAAIVGGCSRADVERYAHGFVELCIAKMIKPLALTRLREHRERGDTIMLATASPDLYVKKLGDRLGFDYVVCTHVAWRANVVVGKLDGPNLRGDAKVIAVQRALLDLREHLEPTVGYSDHHSDLPLLLFVKRGIAVDPTPQLAAQARRHNLQIEYWRKTSLLENGIFPNSGSRFSARAPRVNREP